MSVSDLAADPAAVLDAPSTAEPAWPAPRLARVLGAELLIVPLGAAHETLSWAIVNGGRRRADTVVWRQVTLGELGPGVDARALLARSLEAAGAPGAVGLLTARDVAAHHVASRASAGLRVRCVATVGLSNASAVGDPPGPPPSDHGHPATAAVMGPRVGTINIVCQLSRTLTDEAFIEACALAAEARTAAVLDACLPSPLSTRAATGTGTDCIVVAAPPATDGDEALAFVGKHTIAGALLGACIRDAVWSGIVRWKAEVACRVR